MSKINSGDVKKKRGYLNGGYIFLIMLFVFFTVLALGILFQHLVNINVGTVDKSFGNDGKVQMDFNNSKDRVNGIIEQADGKIIVIGTYSNSSDPSENVDILIARYNENGSLDSEFGDNGKKIIDLGGNDVGIAVNLQVDGKIVAANRSCDSTNNSCKAILIRLNSDGSNDNTFGDAGKQTIEVGDLFHEIPHKFLIDPDGNIILVGSVWNGTDFDFAVYMVNSNGTPTPNFGVDGLTTVGFGAGKADIATDLAIQGDKIVVLGRTCDSVNEETCGVGLTRINSSGNVDKSFGNNGKKSAKLNTSFIPKAIAVQENGSFLIVGDKKDIISKFALIRYKKNGVIDEKFGKKGKVVDNFIKDKNSWGDDVIVQPDGKIVLVGYSTMDVDSSDWALRRYESDGTQDLIFAENGTLFIDFNQLDYGPVILLSSDGKYVVAGSAENATQVDFALSRILP